MKREGRPFISIPNPLPKCDVLVGSEKLYTKEGLIKHLSEVMDAEKSINKLIDTIAERIATVLENKYRVVEYNRPDVDLISHDELTQTIKEAIRTK